MLENIAPDLWHAVHRFTALGLPISSRMTVVRLSGGGLWLHSPVPLTPGRRAALDALGKVEYVVAPSKAHHLFAGDYLQAYPEARLFGAPGLARKRPDLRGMTELGAGVEPAWSADLDQVFFAGIPLGNETVWYHKPSRTLILTDLCQWWVGDLPPAARLYAQLTGVRRQLAVPRTVRLLVRDRDAARASARKILQWPFERVIMAHNAIAERDAFAAVKKAFAAFGA